LREKEIQNKVVRMGEQEKERARVRKQETVMERRGRDGMAKSHSLCQNHLSYYPSFFRIDPCLHNAPYALSLFNQCSSMYKEPCLFPGPVQ
jgi:hypothetical protein